MEAGIRQLALLDRNEYRNTLIFYEEDDELRGLAVARVAADDVNVIRTFIECFAGFERDRFCASQLHHDRTLEHVDEGVRIVPMNFVSATRRVGDHKHDAFFAGNVRERLGHDFFYVGRWSGRRELRGERISSDCDWQDDLFHNVSLGPSSDLPFFQRLTIPSSANAATASWEDGGCRKQPTWQPEWLRCVESLFPAPGFSWCV